MRHCNVSPKALPRSKRKVTVPTTVHPNQHLLIKSKTFPRAVARTRHEVEWQIHDISDQLIDVEAPEGLLERLSESLNRVPPGLYLPSFGDDIALVPGQ